MIESGEGSGESARMRRLIRAFAACIYDNYQNLKNCFKYRVSPFSVNAAKLSEQKSALVKKNAFELKCNF